MNKDVKEVAVAFGATIVEACVGLAMGCFHKSCVEPQCTNKGEKFVALLGMCAVSWCAGRKIRQEIYKVSDECLGTEFMDND